MDNNIKMQLNKDGCNICNNYTALFGCDHHNPQDWELNQPIIDAIVSAVHDNNRVKETSDFMQGVNAALICLRQNNLITI